MYSKCVLETDGRLCKSRQKFGEFQSQHPDGTNALTSGITLIQTWQSKQLLLCVNISEPYNMTLYSKG